MTRIGGLASEFYWRDQRIEKLVERVAELEDANARLREALTPSPATKAAYIGEFSFILYDIIDEDGNEIDQKISVPWMTIKEIMAAIRARAATAPEKGEGG